MIKNSETIIIKRSQINLNPINPKRHTDRAVKLQEKNLKKVGFLGGIVWNRNTGNLIDGHRRIMAMDLYYKYDGANDYDVKVESVELDDKTEKEQLTYMAVGNTKPDIDLIAKYIGDNKFECRGEISRTSPLAKKYLNLYAGMNLTTVNGNEYWYYKGQKLTSLRKN